MNKIIIKCLETNKIKLYSFTLFSLMILINIISMIINFSKIRMKNEIIDKPENRVIYVSSEKDLDNYETIKNILHVEDVYYNTDLPTVKMNEYSDFKLKYINPTVQVKTLYGKSSNFNENEVIISENIAESLNIDIKSNTNNKIKIFLNGTEIELFVVGIYENDNINENYIYIPSNSCINKLVYNKNQYIILIDSMENYDVVVRKLEEYNCFIQYKNDSLIKEIKVYQDVNVFLENFLYISYFFLIIVLLIILLFNISEKKYNIALLKSIGYSEKKIINSILHSYIIIFSVSFLISIFIFKIVDIILLYIFKISYFFNILILTKNLLICYIILLLSCVIMFCKIFRISLIKLLKSN